MPLWKNPVGTDEVAGVAARPLLQIIPVIGLGLPRTRRPAGPRSPLCHPTAPRHPHRRSYPRRRASAPRRHNRCPTGRRAHDHCPGGSASSDRGSGRRIRDVPVARHCRVEDNLDPLGMRAVITIRGVRNIAARVTHTGRDDAGPLADRSCMPQKHPPARTAR